MLRKYHVTRKNNTKNPFKNFKNPSYWSVKLNNSQHAHAKFLLYKHCLPTLGSCDRALLM